MAKRPSKGREEDVELLHPASTVAGDHIAAGTVKANPALIPVSRDLARWIRVDEFHPHILRFLSRLASSFQIPDHDALHLFNVRSDDLPNDVVARWPEAFVSELRSIIHGFIRRVADHVDSSPSWIEESLSTATEKLILRLQPHWQEPPPPKSVTLGDILRRHRMAAGLTQDQLAQLSGVSQAQISQLEKDRWLPRVDALMALAKALGVPAAALLPPDDTPP